MLKQNLFKVIGYVPFLVITILAIHYLLSVLETDYIPVYDVITSDYFRTVVIAVIVFLSIQAIYLARKNKSYDLDLKKLYQYLIVGLIAFVIPAMIFEKVMEHRICGGGNNCLKELHEQKKRQQTETESDDISKGAHRPASNLTSDAVNEKNSPSAVESEAPSPEQLSVVENFAENVQRAGSERDWDKLVKQALLISEYFPPLLVGPLITAFEFNAPVEIIDDIVAMGAPLDENIRVVAISYEGGVERLKALVERGLPLHGLDFIGNNSLHTATSGALNSSVQHTNDVVEFILDNNIDPNELDQDGRSPLFYMLEIAYEEGYDDTIAELIRHGAAVNEQEILALYQLKEVFPERYDALLKKVPELAND